MSNTPIAVACQGGGSHTAFTAGVLQGVLEQRPPEYEVVALSGTSGGAICAALAWDGLRRDSVEGAVDRLDAFWTEIAARDPWDRLLNATTQWGSRATSEFGSVGVSPYYHVGSVVARRRLRRAIERHVGFDDPVRGSPPNLYVGAVDVQSGRFETFVDGEGGADGLLASAAVPTVFRAAPVTLEDRTEYYWDGLFSQNPPIRQFVSEVPVEAKPEEIWIVRINPERRPDTPRSLDDIADRRNELSGNLSLRQEMHTIETVNELIDEGVITDERYKRIRFRELELSAALDVHSKLNRDRCFLEWLRERGRAQADELWAPETG